MVGFRYEPSGRLSPQEAKKRQRAREDWLAKAEEKREKAREEREKEEEEELEEMNPRRTILPERADRAAERLKGPKQVNPKFEKKKREEEKKYMEDLVKFKERVRRKKQVWDKKKSDLLEQDPVLKQMQAFNNRRGGALNKTSFILGPSFQVAHLKETVMEREDLSNVSISTLSSCRRCEACESRSQSSQSFCLDHMNSTSRTDSHPFPGILREDPHLPFPPSSHNTNLTMSPVQQHVERVRRNSASSLPKDILDFLEEEIEEIKSQNESFSILSSNSKKKNMKKGEEEEVKKEDESKQGDEELSIDSSVFSLSEGEEGNPSASTWIRIFDEDLNDYFYFDKESQESVWDLPEGAVFVDYEETEDDI